MMGNPIRVLVLLAGLLAASGVVFAQQYSKLNVKGRVQLEVPADWAINDAEHRKRVAEYAKNLLGVDGVLASLSVSSHPMPSKMFIRVSFLPVDPPITQEDVRKEVAADRRAVIGELAAMWAAESQELWSALAKNGVKEVGGPSFDVETLGGKMALVIHYARTVQGLPGESMLVSQYHVPLGAEKALITLSVASSGSEIRRARDRVKASIRIR